MLGILVFALCARVLQLSQRTLYWDDLVIPAHFSPLSLTGEHSLFRLYDGHLMPASALVQVLVHNAAPLAWWLPALIIVALTLASALAWIPVVRLLLPHHPHTQSLTFAALVFSPFLMDAAGWWSAALNAYAWQLCAAGMLWALLVPPSPRAASPATTRTSTRATTRRWLLPLLILLAGLLFTEKCLTIVPLIAAVLLLRRTPRAQLLPLGPACALWAGWIALYATLSHTAEHYAHPSGLMAALPDALTQAILTGTLGGPWGWERWTPAKAYAATPFILSALSVIAILAALFLLLRRSPHPRRTLCALGISLAYLATLLWLLHSTRDSEHTSGVLLRSMHYYADWWTATIILLAATSARPASNIKNNVRTAIITTLLIVSSTLSLATWTWAWKDDPTRDYLANLRASIREHPQPMLQQQAPLNILLPVLHPYNLIGNITGHGSTDATDRPTMIDDHGRLTEGRVGGFSRTSPGNEPGCGTRIYAGHSGFIHIDNDLPFGEWTWELNAAATHPHTTVTLTTPNGLETLSDAEARASHASIGTELATQWVRVSGGGGLIRIDVHNPAPDASVCIGAGAVGPLILAE
ncbi:hypothetical protein GC425_02485 [Corynebacterium sp. zg254]|uniref:Transmembrane protein n=1 Tax=Corynebacterium zhongnanshanii TaxID=2768834 RepID=A0ABQ6VL21_9CORY|nr:MULTISPECIES: hypothetical protein [Corynebacterium]KAB3523156.1 hypothetical protein F8377_03140 [Corynebacterium zhongnanshanii]MCR5913738.1 hypothetical protein [Corynebacterium sp. zg254]